MAEKNRIITTGFGYKAFENLPGQDFLNDYYSEKYYQNPQGTYQSEYSSQEHAQRKSRIQLLEDFINIHIGSPSQNIKRFLDVGCGEGYVLSHFKDAKWEVTGLDFSTHGVKSNNPDLERFITQGDVYQSIQDLIDKNLKFQVVFLGNILEHVLEPITLLDSLNTLLEVDGLLCITVPNDFSVLQSFLLESGSVNKEYWVVYPDHLNYFSLGSLKKLLLDCNLEIVDQFSDFPIEWYLVNPESNYVVDTSVGKSAHLARVTLDNMINSSPDQSAKMNFWRSLCSMGFGRSITTISRKKGN